MINVIDENDIAAEAVARMNAKFHFFVGTPFIATGVVALTYSISETVLGRCDFGVCMLTAMFFGSGLKDMLLSRAYAIKADSYYRQQSP